MARRGKIKRKVCRNCKLIVEANVQECPNCKSKDFSEEFSGFVLIINEEKSEISQKKGLKKGIWAIKVF